MNTNWFTSRGLRNLDYQTEAIAKVQESLMANNKTLLAACPSAGKTLMAIYIIEDYLRQHPDHKVLILAHGTTILRTQFHEVLKEAKPAFTYALIESCDNYVKSDKSVNVCLPQTLQKCPIKPVDLLIVDEAHHFYISPKAKMVKDIIKKSGVKKQLLLTGTPSKFILENLRLQRDEYHIIPVALNTIFDAGMVADAYVEVASSTYDFTLDDYNNDDELKTSVHIKAGDTNKTLDDLLEQIVHRLRSFRGNVYTNLTPDWKILLKTLKKTMIACRSIQQAEQVKKYLDKRGINSALSTSENDTYSDEIRRFTHEDDCLVLIVVYRGVLGFNFDKLVNVVDMTTSHNVDRIYQLFARVIRVDKDVPDQKKLFFKIAPNMLTDYYKHIMTATLMLADEEFFTKFNGHNFYDMEIPVKKIYRTPKRPHTPDHPTHKQRARKFEPIDMEGLPVFEFFKNILHKKDQLLETYCMTTIRDVRVEFLTQMPSGYWTLERCKEDALNYTTKAEWCKNSNSAYNAAFKNNWLDECTKYLIQRNFLTKETCIESAKNFKNLTDWVKFDGSAYSAAKRNGWIVECTNHMVQSTKVKGYWNDKNICIETAKKCDTLSDFICKYYTAYKYAKKNGWLKECTEYIKEIRHHWTLEECLNHALKYQTITDWIKNEKSIYSAATKHNWLNECTKHMHRNQNPSGYWTKEKCLQSALNYNKPADWKYSSPKAYDAAQRLKCLKECCAHMKEGQVDWAKEKCLESAKVYNTRKEWKQNDNKAYGAAQRNGWLEECCKHMEEAVRKPSGYWTMERCKEDAKNYTTKLEWRKNSSSASSIADKNKWLDKCCEHMEELQKPNGYWTKARCIEDAKQHKTISKWHKNSGGAYNAARRLKCMEECTAHMKKNLS